MALFRVFRLNFSSRQSNFYFRHCLSYDDICYSRGLAFMIWRLAKDHYLPEFWPYGRLMGIENETSQKYCAFVRITGRHKKSIDFIFFYKF